MFGARCYQRLDLAGACVPHLEGTRFDECGMLFPPAMAMSKGVMESSDLNSSLREAGLDISPVTDDYPFFYNFEAGIPRNVSLILWVSTVSLTLIIIVSLHRKNRPSREGKNRIPVGFALLFSILGAGFMLAEISLFQRFTLFLGQPVLALTVCLASLLVGAGLGSLCSGRLSSEKLGRVIPIAALAVAAVLVVYALLLPSVFNTLLGLELGTRVLMAVLLLLVPGFAMGFPFPLGLRLLKEAGIEAYIPWAWGINGVASVVGSVSAIVIALSFGFTEALLAGAALYFLLFLMFRAAGNAFRLPLVVRKK